MKAMERIPLLAIAAAASDVPARQAARADPTEMLRNG
jgi:ABC-type lipoprotein release transport system permease subunit